ncbi:MAG TPA: rod shape-determining protein MreC [Terriglobales bacterium]|nr:rod shape-determining protein MreC [Terriglobales bacterium]
MDKIVSRHKNLWVLALALFIQVLALGVQVKRPTETGSVSLIRVWTIRTITPVQKALVGTSDWVFGIWHNYINIRSLRTENERLQNENWRLRMEQVRMLQDASQAQRLQALLKFKEQYIAETIAAQVIGTSGSETSRVLYIDRGAEDGLEPDMAVITPTGVVGKIMRVFPATAQVLEINDQTSGIGVILEKSRLQGILRGTPSGDALMHYVMSDEKVQPGEMVLTSGGDRIYPKGLPVGRVISVNPGTDMFLNIRVKPSARLDRIEEVLVIKKIDERQPDLIPENPQRAADILAARLPSVPVKPPENAPPGQVPTGVAAQTAQAGTQGQAPKPQGASAVANPVSTGSGTSVVPASPRSSSAGQSAPARGSATPNGAATRPEAKPTPPTAQ